MRERDTMFHKCLYLAVLILGVAHGAFANEPFFHDGRTDWKIYLSPQAAPTETFAAEELRSALKKISGAEFEVLSSAEAPPRRAIIIGDLNNPQVQLRAEALNLHAGKVEQIAVSTLDGRLYLAGNQPRGALYAVYRFLQQELGVRWLWPGPDGEFMPAKESWSLPNLEYHYKPAFAYRGFHLCGDWRDVDRWRLAIEGNPSAAAVAKKNQGDLALLKDTFRTTDFRELLAHGRVDAVMISTPDHWHVPIALAAIKAGKDVALEKPIRLAIAHGRVLADAAAKAKTVFRTDSNFRSEPELFRAVSLVRTGKIGQLKTIRMSVPIYPVPAPNETPMPVPADLDDEMWQGPAQRQPYTEDRVHPNKKFGRPGRYSNRLYCDGMICNWGHHPADLVKWDPVKEECPGDEEANTLVRGQPGLPP